MKKIYNILMLIIGFVLITGLVYATVTVASVRKSNKLPWQGIPNGYYYGAHNVGTTYSPQSRFSFISGTTSGGTSVVYDNVTGFYWQSNGTISLQQTWDSAKNYCTALVLGGFSDWRLPSFKELPSIVDLSRYQPTIDINYFTSNANLYWSSTTSSYDINYARYVDFYTGNVNRRLKTTSLNMYVRCLR